eukprot:gnl/Hemi2/26386_TR8856_c0_g1_i1.p1 gnl/Hemi2/26386_TR8856_c0_g1~~gnl/Hemi2/26386_TR8856_c0_g1_i1.p1  ORF type:complete len:229 (+),score=3.19 gnl/Hemi2/26386_TR8856_c0_g1_i1:46-732(+)
MLRVSLLVTLGILYFGVAAAATACTNSNTCGSSSPFCINGICMQCRPSSSVTQTMQQCDCPAGQFCSSANATQGQCLSFGSPVGSACDPSITVNSIYYKQNDAKFCGGAVFAAGASTGDSPISIDWVGGCVSRTCQMCKEQWGNGAHTRSVLCNGNGDYFGAPRVCIGSSYVADVRTAAWLPALFGEQPRFVMVMLSWLFLFFAVCVMTANLFKNRFKWFSTRWEFCC